MNYWVYKNMFERKETHSTNQTEFVDQAQFLEKESSGLLNFRDLKKNKNLVPFIVLMFLIIFFALLIILRVLFKKDNVEMEPTKEVQKEVQSGPLNLRAEELRENLKMHNPTKQSLPFPQVDLEFNIN